MTDPRYPIGRFQPEPELTEARRRELIDQFAEAPAQLRAAVEGLTAEQLDTPYREGGWTVRQVVHHLPDSHMNAYVRFKLALTGECPLVKPFDEKLWAETPEARTGPIEDSLDLLESLHRRAVRLLRSLTPTDFARTLRHPEHGVVTLDHYFQLYVWHGRHHIAHITSLRERMGW